MINSHLLSRVALAGVLLVALTSCAAEESKIKQVAEAGLVEPAAENMCNAMVGGYPLVAAYESTVSEIRSDAADVKVQEGWDRNLPTVESTAMSVCIYDVHEVDGIGDSYSLMAMWVGQDSRTGGNGIITLWNR